MSNDNSLIIEDVETSTPKRPKVNDDLNEVEIDEVDIRINENQEVVEDKNPVNDANTDGKENTNDVVQKNNFCKCTSITKVIFIKKHCFCKIIFVTQARFLCFSTQKEVLK